MRASRQSAAVLFLIAVPLLPARSQQADADVRQKIVQASLSLDSAYRRGNAQAVSTLFTDDAIISAIEFEDIRGRAAIQAALAGFFAANTVLAYQLQPVEVEVCGPTAYERGTFVWTSGPHGQPASTVRGRYSAVWMRAADGAWRVHRYIENLLPAATQPR